MRSRLRNGSPLVACSLACMIGLAVTPTLGAESSPAEGLLNPCTYSCWPPVERGSPRAEGLLKTCGSRDQHLTDFRFTGEYRGVRAVELGNDFGVAKGRAEALAFRVTRAPIDGPRLRATVHMIDVTKVERGDFPSDDRSPVPRLTVGTEYDINAREAAEGMLLFEGCDVSRRAEKFCPWMRQECAPGFSHPSMARAVGVVRVIAFDGSSDNGHGYVVDVIHAVRGLPEKRLTIETPGGFQIIRHVPLTRVLEPGMVVGIITNDAPVDGVLPARLRPPYAIRAEAGTRQPLFGLPPPRRWPWDTLAGSLAVAALTGVIALTCTWRILRRRKRGRGG